MLEVFTYEVNLVVSSRKVVMDDGFIQEAVIGSRAATLVGGQTVFSLRPKSTKQIQDEEDNNIFPQKTNDRQHKDRNNRGSTSIVNCQPSVDKWNIANSRGSLAQRVSERNNIRVVGSLGMTQMASSRGHLY